MVLALLQHLMPLYHLEAAQLLSFFEVAIAGALRLRTLPFWEVL
jgi:hypothetical protein